MDLPLENVAGLFRILSDPTRLRIVRVLTLECRSVSAIVRATGLAQPLVSHHLRILREHGLARAEPRGGLTYYWLYDKAVWETVERSSEIVTRSRRNAPAAAKASVGLRGRTGRRKRARVPKGA